MRWDCDIVSGMHSFAFCKTDCIYLDSPPISVCGENTAVWEDDNKTAELSSCNWEWSTSVCSRADRVWKEARFLYRLSLWIWFGQQRVPNVASHRTGNLALTKDETILKGFKRSLHHAPAWDLITPQVVVTAATSILTLKLAKSWA